MAALSRCRSINREKPRSVSCLLASPARIEISCPLRHYLSQLSHAAPRNADAISSHVGRGGKLAPNDQHAEDISMNLNTIVYACAAILIASRSHAGSCGGVSG